MSGKAKENLHDRVCYTILRAPDRFPGDMGMNLEKSFSEMHAHLAEAYESSSKEYESIKSLLDCAYASYRKDE